MLLLATTGTRAEAERYLAAPGGFALPRVLRDVTLLISGGVSGLVTK